jgi:hypothetical protein
MLRRKLRKSMKGRSSSRKQERVRERVRERERQRGREGGRVRLVRVLLLVPRVLFLLFRRLLSRELTLRRRILPEHSGSTRRKVKLKFIKTNS